MHLKRIALVFAAALTLFALGAQRTMADPISYDAFVKDAQPQRGLFTIWRKAGKVYLELAADQLNREFIQSIVPASGLGRGLIWGNTDHLPTELVRFERTGNSVAILWPSPYFVAPHSPASARAIEREFSRSIVGIAPIAAVDERSGAVVIDAAPFLEDQLNLKAVLRQRSSGARSQPYTLNRERTYFGSTKAFPNNIVLQARQDWASEDQRLSDVLADPRHVQIDVVYNIAEPPHDNGYRPRLADDRMGIYDDVYLQFDQDKVLTRNLRYVVRWNLQPSDPSKRISPAMHPMVFYMSNTVPEAYRPAIKAAVLKWNGAFEKIGISGALEVRDQPNDPNWDPDDIRYSVLRWITESRASFGADSQTLFDPRTGEEFRTGILISADVPVNALREWTYVIDPVRYGRSTDPMPQQYLDDTFMSTILHETGHNLGMQHNFIGSLAYTAKQLQDKQFTAKYGITSTVMEYAPTNLWPKPYGQGEFHQVVLGPYDYYAIKWTYAAIPGAMTPAAELPTLRKWASAWSDPLYRYASDEDVSWANGHASDPRSNTGDLTNDSLGWCKIQMGMQRNLMATLNDRFPVVGDEYDTESDVFTLLFRQYSTCAMIPTHFIGGQYLSRAHRGDPHAEPPIVPVPRAEQKRAFDVLDRYVFSAEAWRLPASLLNKLGYSEWAGYGFVNFEGYGNLPQWAYAPPERHDMPVSENIARLQAGAIRQMFQPLVLARIAAGPSESNEKNPMQLADLFDWMHRSVYRELDQATRPIAIEASRRVLQQRYMDTLVALFVQPEAGAPADARALARAELASLQGETERALHGRLDRVTRAHVELLYSRADEALHGHRAQ